MLLALIAMVVTALKMIVMGMTTTKTTVAIMIISHHESP